METTDMHQVAKQSGRNHHTVSDKIEAIACGVQARFEETTGYSKKITDTTIRIARTMGIPEPEIERWASQRPNLLGQGTEGLDKIRSVLAKAFEPPLPQ